MLSEAIEKMTDISMNLCNVLCLPQRDYVEGGVATSKSSCLEEHQSPSLPASPGMYMYNEHGHLILACMDTFIC